MVKKNAKQPAGNKSGEKEKVVVPKSTQQTIPFTAIHDNGILQLSKTQFSKMYSFMDSNFIVEPEDKQEDILLDYSKLLNRFQTNVSLMFVILNKRISNAQLKKMFHLEELNDNLNDYRSDYNSIIDAKIEEGRNDIQKDKYIIVTVDTPDYNSAVSLFNTVDVELAEAVRQINRTGVRALSTKERLSLAHYVTRGVTDVPFETMYEQYFDADNEFDEKAAKKRGVTPRDMIAPFVIEKISKPRNSLRIGEERYCKSFMFTDLPISLDTRFLSEISNIPCEMVTTVLFTSVPRQRAVRDVKVQNNAIKADVYDATRRASKQGIYDRDIAVNEDLQQAQEEAKTMRHDVIVDGKKIFYVTITNTMFANSDEELKELIDLYQMKCMDFTANADPLIGQQIAGLKTALMCGGKYTKLDRMLTSDSACALFPFNIQELMDKNGHFYGCNSVSKNMIMYNRRTSDLPNGLIFGRSGSGKSFITKGEIIPNLLDGEDDVIILDPDGEYVAIAKEFGGTVIDLDNRAEFYINPCDMSMEYNDKKVDPLAEKCDFMVGLVESILGNGRECNSFEVNVIHRCTKRMYEPYIAHMEALHEAGSSVLIDTEASPTLVDFYEELIGDNSPEGNKLAMACEQYCIGNYNLFAHKTNVENKPRFLVYNLKRLPEKMQEFAMKVCFSNIWNRVTENSDAGKATWIYLDEFYLLMNTESSATTLQRYFKRIRKYFGIMTGITQDIEDMTKSSQGRGMIENAGFLLIMNQSPTGRANVQKRYEVSDALIENIKDKPPGYGLIYTGKTLIPFNYSLPKDTKLYKLMSTKPAED